MITIQLTRSVDEQVQGFHYYLGKLAAAKNATKVRRLTLVLTRRAEALINMAKELNLELRRRVRNFLEEFKIEFSRRCKPDRHHPCLKFLDKTLPAYR